MYLPEPVLALVVAYHADGDPVRRALARTRAALKGEGTTYAEIRRLMDLKAYELYRGELQRRTRLPKYQIPRGRFHMAYALGDRWEAVYAAGYLVEANQQYEAVPKATLVAGNLAQTLSWQFENDIEVACSVETDYVPEDALDEEEQEGENYDAVFVCTSTIEEYTPHIDIHNGVNAFVV